MAAFAVRQLGWPASGRASGLLSSFYGSFCVGRLVGIFTSLRLKTGLAVAVDVGVSAAGYGALLAAGLTARDSVVSDALAWTGAVTIGLGTATILGLMAVILLDGSADHLSRSGVTAATYGTGACLGSVIESLAVGYLFDHWTPLSAVYIAFAGLGGLSALLGVRWAVIGGRGRRLDSVSVEVTESTRLLFEHGQQRRTAFEVTSTTGSTYSASKWRPFDNEDDDENGSTSSEKLSRRRHSVNFPLSACSSYNGLFLVASSKSLD